MKEEERIKIARGKRYDVYELKGLSEKEIREGYRVITGLDNDNEMTADEVHQYLLYAMSEGDDEDIFI